MIYVFTYTFNSVQYFAVTNNYNLPILTRDISDCNFLKIIYIFVKDVLSIFGSVWKLDHRKKLIAKQIFICPEIGPSDETDA